MAPPKNLFKQALADGRRIYGSWATLCSPMAVEACSAAGFDFMVLDMEHSPNDVPEIMSQLQACASGGTTAPVVRLMWNDMVLVKRVMDIGAQSILFPFVQTAEEAAKAVSYTRYPPQGVRGVAGMQRANRYGAIGDYLQTASQEVCVHVQIETVAALSRLEEIAAVEGVDGIFIGPSDLSADLGHLGNIMHPDVHKALADGAARCARLGKPVGIIAVNDQLAKLCVEWGYSYIALGTDMGMMMQRARQVLAQFRG